MIPPLAGLWLLFRQKVSVTGVKAGNISRLNIAFLAAVLFDIIRIQGLDWAVYGIFASLYTVFNAVGILGFNLYYPETRSNRQVLAKGMRHVEFYIYHLTLLAWLITNIFFPAFYLPSALVLAAMLIIHPTRLFLMAKKKSVPGTGEMLTMIEVSWLCFVTIAFILFALGANPPLLGTSLPFAWQLAFLSGSVFFLFMSKAVTNPAGLNRRWASLLVPETIVKMGQKYLIVHDTGEKARFLLSASFKKLIETGVRIIVQGPTPSLFLDETFQTDPIFQKWGKQGKLVTLEKELKASETSEKTLEKLGLENSGVLFVTELDDGNLSNLAQTGDPNKTFQKTSELFLLENSKVTRAGLAEFLRDNRDVQFLDLSTPKAPFANMLNLQHSKLQGSAILLEYSRDSNIGETVQRFLAEGVSNAELCAVFTTKSSKLYRSIKGTKRVKLVAASPLVSAPDELPDGEVQIPDRELGLVTSIASDLLEANKDLPACLVFDSITELVRGDQWEQVYSGIKQLAELVALPNATALFLANQDTLEPHFLGALRSTFPILLKLDRSGLQATKLP